MVGGPYSGSASGEVTLTTIPRASSVTCADGNIGSSTTININRASSSFTHTLKYSFGTLSGTIATKTSNTSIGWTIPTSFYGQIPNAKSGQGTITCETYNGSTLIGTDTCPFNAIVLESNNTPTITATVTDVNSTTTTLTGDPNVLVKYFSNAKVVITAIAKNSATIKSQKVTCGDGKSSTSITSTLNTVESGTFTLTCTDSRGFPGTNTVTKTMINYIKLAITSLSIKRESSTSNTVNISLKGNYFNGSFGSISNTLTLKWRYRLKDGAWSGYTTILPILSENTFSYSGILGTIFDYKQAYDFEIAYEDKLISDVKIQPVTAGIPLVDIWKDNVNVNGELNIDGDLKENGYSLPTYYLRSFNRTMASNSTNLDDPGINGLFEVKSNSEATYTGTKPYDSYYPFLNLKTPDNIAMMQLAGRNGNLYYRGTQRSNVTMSGISWSKIRDSSSWGVTLYNNTSGTNGTVTLSESASNFSFLEIYYKAYGNIYDCAKVVSPNGKTVNLKSIYSNYNATNVLLAPMQCDITISGTTLTPARGSYTWNSQSGTYKDGSNAFYIYHVIGYR